MRTGEVPGTAVAAVAGLLGACGDGGGGGDVTLDAVSSVDPPAEIGDEWETVIDRTEQNIEAESNDGSNFDGTDESEAAYERVVTYVDVQCSVYLGSS